MGAVQSKRDAPRSDRVADFCELLQCGSPSGAYDDKRAAFRYIVGVSVDKGTRVRSRRPWGVVTTLARTRSRSLVILDGAVAPAGGAARGRSRPDRHWRPDAATVPPASQPTMGDGSFACR